MCILVPSPREKGEKQMADYDRDILPYRTFDEPEDDSEKLEEEIRSDDFDETGGAWGDYKNG